MGAASIPVDLFNPGQVFACLGLAELAARLGGSAAGGFDWSEAQAPRFFVSSPGLEQPVEAALAFLDRAQVVSVAPKGVALSTQPWGIETRPSAQLPAAPPASPAALPAVLEHDGVQVLISSWAEGGGRGRLGAGRDNVKFWAGAGGYPGAALLRDALELARPGIPQAAADPFAQGAPQSSSFRFDWRRDYIPLDIGFSLNAHTGMEPQGYPLVEILAALGLQDARPLRRNKLLYRYAVLGRSGPADPEGFRALPLPLLRAALGCAALPFPTRTFTLHLDWPGQENQARCITTVTEENTP